ncbi:alkylphosphonate utilization protein [Helicobacter pylori]|uniref:zinc ribbon domain-containing protein YjdM n=1 Tax=Helicobacter pylori TaxID=210 RepID=UPI000FDEA2A7|nr:zinc ribbon domain-containing protein YjdM [Helicobacter pylori]RVY38860.1 alkylphosphonate utilization protein [Helicobacter pylori]RVY88885.1 alkylphosphonate utilization protein [Helicobacter pylori]
MQDLPPCPKCNDACTYHDGAQLVCSSCLYEWNENEVNDEELIVKDCHNNLLQNGDSVILIKDLKVKGSSLVLKKGTKIKNIRLVNGDHNVDCKIEGQSLSLKSEFLKKA